MMTIALCVAVAQPLQGCDSRTPRLLHGRAPAARNPSLRLSCPFGGGARTRFHLEKQAGVDWLVGRDGRKFFSFGVCCVDQGVKPKDYDAKNRGYAAYRNYLSPPEWAKDTLDRLATWGFNTVGAWSDNKELMAVKRPELLFTPILHIGSSAGAPWRDMWDPKVVAAMDAVARDQIRAFQDDPRIVGYFSDNEMGWWYGAMFDWSFRAGAASRHHLVDLFEKRYNSSWVALKRDFDPDGATSFAQLRGKGRLFLRPGGQGMPSVQAWMSVVSERYYSLCRQIIKRYDPAGLYLGDRYISNFYPEIARSAGKFCDVVSTNLNADDDLGDFARFYLPALHADAKRPLMITEYYVAAKENRSGNLNNSSGFPVVETQAARARVFRNETATMVETPYIVGAHWFQYYDEPGKGRGDGENYDMGLVDVDNRPYEEMTTAAREARPSENHAKSARAAPTARPHTSLRRRTRLGDADQSKRCKRAPSAREPQTEHGVPKIPADRLRDIAWWLENGGFVPPDGLSQRGDLYLAQNDGWLYAALYWNEDRFSEAFYRGGKVPPQDEPRLNLQFDGARRSFLMSEETSKDFTAFKFGVRNYVILRLAPVMATHLEASLITRGRAYDTHWATPLDFKQTL